MNGLGISYIYTQTPLWALNYSACAQTNRSPVEPLRVCVDIVWTDSVTSVMGDDDSSRLCQGVTGTRRVKQR